MRSFHIAVLILLHSSLWAAQNWRPAPEIHFEPNVGQAEPGIRYVSRGARSELLMRDTSVALQLRGKDGAASLLSLSWADAAANTRSAAPMARPQGEVRQAGVTNFLIGRDTSRWRTGVSHFGKVRYREVYPGIDLVFYGNGEELEYDFVVRPGARASQVRLRFSGHRQLRVNGDGDLVLTMAGGETASEVIQRRPRVYQDRDGNRVEIASSYALHRDGTVGIRLGDFDAERELVIDPVLSYATYWGGASDDLAPELALDQAGNVYLFGDTNSSNLPVTTGAYKTTRPGGPFDNYVTKFGTDGKVIWSTFVGGANDETAAGIAVDATGSVYLLGSTNSNDFPVSTTAPQATRASGGQMGTDVFIAKLNATGTALVYATYLGGNNDDTPVDIAVNSSGEAFVSGFTLATNFPTTNGALKTRDDAVLIEGFVTKMDATGARFAYSTYIGGTVGELVSGIAVDQQGNAYITGSSFSPDFAVTAGAAQSTRRGVSDAFILKLNPFGSAVVYNTLLGGSTGSDTPLDIAIDTAGNAYITGVAESSDFPVTLGALQGTRQGTSDTFIAKINPTGSTVVYATYLGGNGTERGESIVVDAAGSAYLLITSTSTAGLTPVQGFQNAGAGGADLFVAKLSVDGNTVVQSSFLGGNGTESGRSIAVDARDRAYVSASTTSTNIAGTAGSAQPAAAGGRDGFWARLDFSAPAVTLSVSPATITATGQTGGAIARQQLSLVAQAGQRPDWNIEVATQPAGGQWIAVSPTSGSGSATVDVNFTPGTLAAGTYNATITVVNRSANNTRTNIPVTMTLTAAGGGGGQLTSAGVLSAASFQGGGVSPGLIVTIFGQRIGPDRLVSAEVTADLKFPTTVSETRVLFDGVAAPLIYVSAGQVSAIVPYAVASRTATDLVIEYRGVRSNAVSVPVVAAKPGLFTANASGTGPGAIRNQDLSVNTSSNPAARGSIVVLYATGEGATDPAGVDGQVAANVYPKPRLPVAVRIGGVNAEVLYAGAAPSLVAGVMQVNAKVPDNVPDGNVPIQIVVGNAESPAGVTVAVLGDLTTKN